MQNGRSGSSMHGLTLNAMLPYSYLAEALSPTSRVWEMRAYYEENCVHYPYGL